MNKYKEEDFLQISGIEHFKFCRRQWALIYIEKQWIDNMLTVKGNIIHKNAHNKFCTESRKDIIITRGMPVYSKTLGINGECDVVEFRKEKSGIHINGKEGLYKVCPIEYKKGKPTLGVYNNLQLCAQVMCLEEMLECNIDEGYIYYNDIKRREKVLLNDELRKELRKTVNEMHDMYKRKYTPKVRYNKACNACSLKDICLPAICKNISAQKYINKILGGELNEKNS